MTYSTRLAPLLLSLLLLLAAGASWPARAHGGEDHSHDEPAAAAAPAAADARQVAPRALAQTDEFELVAVPDPSAPGVLRLYLDHYATNEPVTGASVEVESGGHTATARPVEPGVYLLQAPGFARAGRHAMTITVEAGDTADLIEAVLVVEDRAAQAGPAPAGTAPGWVGAARALSALVIVVALGLAVFLWRRARTARQAVALAAFAALGAFMALAPPAAHAHAGEDHSAPTPAAASPGAAPPDAARRQPDGSLWVPKPVQHRLGLRTVLTRPAAHALGVELNGRVLADPAAGGRVQATQAGRIEAGPQGLPLPGQRVARGQVLAWLQPAAASLERGSQQAALVETEAQLALAERRAARYEQLDGAIPRKDIEAARIERDALRKRRAALQAGVSGREALVAPVSGVVAATHVVLGQVVDAKDLLFDIVDPARLAVEALAYEPSLPAQGLRDAAVLLPDGRRLELQWLGGGTQLREQALPLLFRVRPPPAGAAGQPGLPPLAVGQAVKVVARTGASIQGHAVPREALARNAGGETIVWLHEAPERYVARPVRVAPLDGARVVVTQGLPDAARVVTTGAGLLGQVR